MNRPYSKATAALLAEAMHKALDAVDEGWHLSCLEPDADEGSGSCFKGRAARRMLEEDVAPAVLSALAKAGLLLPEGAETRTEYGVETTLPDGRTRTRLALDLVAEGDNKPSQDHTEES